ncbi:MAG: hypothetical protein SGPRY_013533, partial [Prymnesium sp.]
LASVLLLLASASSRFAMMAEARLLHVSKEQPHCSLGLDLIERRGRRAHGLLAVCMGASCLERSRHVIVASIDPLGPAARAGMSGGDELLAINGEQVTSRVGAETQLRLADAGSVQILIKPATHAQLYQQQAPVVGIPVN